MFSLQDLEYKKFHCKLMPTVDADRVIGIRTPLLRQFSKEIKQTEESSKFLSNLPHEYYEENNLHAFLIEQIKDYDTCMAEVKRFLPYVDNWATCDMMRPKCFKNHRKELLKEIRHWLASKHPYEIRFGIEMLMVHFLEEDFEEGYLQMVAAVQSEEYYVNMMIAWYFATALAKQYDSTIPYLEERKLAKWVHNKTIQKAVESYRVDAKKKAYLKTLRYRK